MKFVFRISPYLLLFLIVYSREIYAQNINADTVYVASTSMIQITFHSPIDKASMPNGDRSYEITVTSDAMSIMVTALKKNTKDQLLIVKEGNREHKLLLCYKENTAPRLIDWSDLKKLDEHVKKNRVPAAENETVKDAGHKTPQQASTAVNPAVQPAETVAEKNRNALAEANLLFKQGRLQEARQKYMSITDPAFADLIPPRITEIDKQLKKQQQAAKTGEKEDSVKQYMVKGDKALRAGLFEEAEINYAAALKINPNSAVLKKKLSDIQVKKTSLAFNVLKKKADSAFQKKDFETAKMAYEEALTIRAGDNYATGRLRDIQVSQNEPKYLEAKRIDSVKGVEYKKAVSTADKLYELKGYDIAAEEYRRALRIFPDSSYPGNQLKKISQLRPDAQKEQPSKEIKHKQR